MEEITVDVNREFNEYIKLVFVLYYRNVVVILMNLFGVMMLVSGIWDSIKQQDLKTSTNYSDNSYIIGIFFGAIFIFVLPLRRYIHAQKRFLSVKGGEESIKYTFSDSEIKAEAVSFNTSIKWSIISKVAELKEFIVIYNGKQITAWVPKRSFSEEKLGRFRNLLRSISGLKVELKGRN